MQNWSGLSDGQSSMATSGITYVKDELKKGHPLEAHLSQTLPGGANWLEGLRMQRRLQGVGFPLALQMEKDMALRIGRPMPCVLSSHRENLIDLVISGELDNINFNNMLDFSYCSLDDPHKAAAKQLDDLFDKY